MDLWSYFFISIGVLSVWTPRIQGQPSQTASFHGGHFNVSQQHSSALTLELHYKSPLNSGIILMTSSVDTPSTYLALAASNLSHIELIVNQDSSLATRLVAVDQTKPWHRLSLNLHGTSLELSVDGTTLTHTLPSQLAYSTVLLGGPESFHSRPPSNLPSSYFIGCMANVSINGYDVMFDSSHPGVQPGCCIAARPFMYCFESDESNLSFRTSILPSPAGDNRLQVSFQIQAHLGGHVTSIGLNSSAGMVVLSNGSLSLHLTLPHPPTTTVQCPGDINQEGVWHTVTFTFDPTSVSCDVGGARSSVTVQLPTLELTQITFGRPNYIPEGMTTFSGCVRRLKVNSADLSPELAVSTNLNDVINYDEIDWRDIQVELRTLEALEGESVWFTRDTLLITLPPQIYSDEHATVYEQEIQQAIQVQTTDGPNEGYFAQGNSTFRLSDFTYYDVISLDEEEQIQYRHGGSINTTDTATLVVTVGCREEREVLFEGPLVVEVQLRNDIPVVSRRQRMRVAMGTSRVITSDIITVSDEETKDPENILYSVVGTTSPACGSCEGETIGAVVRTHNPSLHANFFSQATINSGNISFQHYPRFRTAEVTIILRVSDDLGSSIDTSIEVQPYEGHISLLTPQDECLFVKEGGFALLDAGDLNATTDFEDQQPVITYDVLSEAKLGALQKLVSFPVPGGARSQWITLGNLGGTTNEPHSFTQEDINRGRVRYVHHNSSQLLENLDNVGYQLRSTELLGPTGNFCIDVIVNGLLHTPDISIDIQPISVTENGRVTIDDQTLTTDIDLAATYILDPIDPDQLGIVYFLVDTPSVGALELNSRLLRSGDNFTESEMRAGYLEYVHDGSERHGDTFSLYAQAIITDDLLLNPPNVTTVVTANVTVSPVNDNPPRLSSNLEPIQPAEGGWITVTTRHINVEDEDRPEDAISIFMRNPRKGRPEETPIGYFALASNPKVFERTFTLDQVRRGEVIFVHEMNESQSASLEYTQRLRIHDGEHFERPSISVEAIPLLLTTNTHLPPSQCLAHLNAIDEDPKFILNRTHFSFMLTDHHGNDSNLVPNILVRVSSPPSYGTLARINGGRREPVSQFRVADILHHLIEYSLQGEWGNVTADHFTLTFTYGHSRPVSLPLRVCIEPLPVPRLVHVGGVSVPYNGVVGIGPAHLLANATHGVPDSLEYRITREPRYGFIFNQSSDGLISISHFSQADIDAEGVAYQHSGSSHSQEDSFEFHVCNAYGCSEAHTFPLDIFFVNLTLVNTGFSLLENSTHVITLAEMNIFAPDAFKNRKFLIKRPPIHGTLLVDSLPAAVFSVQDLLTNSVKYKNDQLEVFSDTFEFNATAKSVETGNFLYMVGVVNITIIPVNNYDPEIVVLEGTIIVAEGGSVTFSSEWLQAHDADSNNPDEEILYIIKPNFPPFLGYFYLDDDPGSSISYWTEGQLRSGRVSYRHNRPDTFSTIDVVVFRLSDGERKSLDNSFIIEIKDIIFEKCAPGVGRVSLVEGGTTNITINELCYDASNDDSIRDEDYIYVIKALPGQGALSFNSDLLEVGSRFSQAQLRASYLSYSHDHSNEEEDSFTFDIIIQSRDASEQFTFDLHIVSIDDDPPQVTILKDPVFVVELGQVIIDSTVLDIVDRDSTLAKEVDNIVCNVTVFPRYGLLPKNRFAEHTLHVGLFTKFDVDRGHFGYNHTTLGSTRDSFRDSFTFNITDGVNHQNDTYTVNIVILPNDIQLSVGIITVVENGYVTLREEDIRVQHDYLQTINGRIIIQPGGEPQRGEFRRNTSDCSSDGQPITEFTMDEIRSGSIIYCHGGSEHSNDSFQFVYASIGPEGYDRMSDVYSLYVDVSPLNDQKPVLWKYRETRIEPWTGDNVLLDTRYLNATDGDTSDDGLFYTILVHNDGFIAFVDNPLIHIQTFTQQDVNNGRVIYVHKFDREGYISYQVTDNVFSASGNITVSSRDLLIQCNRERWRQLEVDFKGMASLNTSHLECSTNDAEMVRPITYTLDTIRHGELRVDGVQRSEFNSSELSLGVVHYVHTDVDYWEPVDRIIVVASTPLANDMPISLPIRINYPSTRGSSLAVNTGMELSEGSWACLSEDILDARNLRYSTYKSLNDDITTVRDVAMEFRVTSLPAHGELRYQDNVTQDTPTFTQDDIIAGVVCYHHDDSENYHDIIPFELVIGSGSVVRDLVNISILPVNDERPYLVMKQPNITLVKGFNRMLSQQILEVLDKDTPPANIRFTLDSQAHNAKLINTKTSLEVNEFTQEDINQGVLELRPGEQVGNGSFVFDVRDESTDDDPLNCEFRVDVEEHMLNVSGRKRLEFRQNEIMAAITREALDSWTNGFRGDTRYTVTTSPNDGYISVDGSPTTSFTQEEVDGGRVNYVPRSKTQQYEDSFTVQVKNKDQTVSDVVVLTKVLVMGGVRETTDLNFSDQDPSDLSLPLPEDLLSLDRLQSTSGALLFIDVIDGPFYGQLEKRFILDPDRHYRQVNHEEDHFTFKYNELTNGWVFYTWNSSNGVPEGTSVSDTITVVVRAKGMKPGEAVVHLQITAPVGVTPPPPPSSPRRSTGSELAETPSQSSSTDDGFPMYVLVPIIGVILILILVIVVVVLFCLTQQNKIRKKLQPNVGSSTHNHAHYPVPLTTAPRPMFSPHYDYDPSGPTELDSDNEDQNSDTSSGFSEPISLHHSPAHSPHLYPHVPIPHMLSRSHVSSAYSNPPVRPRVRSNVSITFSGRNSVTSDLSVEDSPEYYSHSLPRPPFQHPLAVPVRPASHTAFRDGGGHTHPPPNMESGYASITIRGGTPDDVTMETIAPLDLEEDVMSQSKLGVPSSDHMTFPNALEEDDMGILPDFSNPSVFRVGNIGPVLKKEEYWI